jgi:hypothetical protein
MPVSRSRGGQPLGGSVRSWRGRVAGTQAPTRSAHAAVAGNSYRSPVCRVPELHGLVHRGVSGRRGAAVSEQRTGSPCNLAPERESLPRHPAAEARSPRSHRRVHRTASPAAACCRTRRPRHVVLLRRPTQRSRAGRRRSHRWLRADREPEHVAEIRGAPRRSRRARLKSNAGSLSEPAATRPRVRVQRAESTGGASRPRRRAPSAPCR